MAMSGIAMTSPTPVDHFDLFLRLCKVKGEVYDGRAYLMLDGADIVLHGWYSLTQDGHQIRREFRIDAPEHAWRAIPP